VNDEDVVALLNDTTVAFRCHVSRFRDRYMTIRRRHKLGLPVFDEALARGWFYIVAGRISISDGFRLYLRREHPPYENKLMGLLYWSWQLEITIANSKYHENSFNVQELTSAEAHRAWQRINPRTPAWVVARAWDRSKKDDILQWIEKYELLGAPELVPSEAWDASTADAFCSLALQTITNADLALWHEVPTDQAVSQLILSGDIQVINGTVPPSSHILKSYLDHRGLHHSGSGHCQSREISILVMLVAADIAHRDQGPIPHLDLSQLVALAHAYPVVLYALESAVRYWPKLLADLLIDQEMIFLAIYWIATWQIDMPEHEHEYADYEQRFSMFCKAVDVLEDMMLIDDFDAVPLVVLITSIQNSAVGNRPRNLFAMKQVRRLVEAVSRATSKIQSEIIASAISLCPKCIDSAEFQIALNLLTVVPGNLRRLATKWLNNSYQHVVVAVERWTDLEDISPRAACMLLEAVMQEKSGKQFLAQPLMLGKGKEEQYKALSLAAHLRLLARAITSYQGAAPLELFDAFRKSLKLVGRFEFEYCAPFCDYVPFLPYSRKRLQRPFGEELANALNTLSAQQQRKILEELVRVELPGMLAVVHRAVSSPLRTIISSSIDEHLDAVLETMGYIPEMQAMAGQLLDAGFVDAADRVLTQEFKMREMRQAKQFDLENIRLVLRMHSQRGQAEKIHSFQIPPYLNEPDRINATQTREFYLGLVYLQEGSAYDPNKAAAVFNRLMIKHRTAPYVINLLASRLSKLLHGGTFTELADEDRSAAAFALNEAENAIAKLELDEVQTVAYQENRALLQLALGWQANVIESVRSIPVRHRSPLSYACEAVALSRVGRSEEGLILIKDAEERWGRVSVLSGAQEHIRNHASFQVRASIIRSDIRAESINNAFSEFQNLPASQQVAIRSNILPERALEKFLTRSIQQALSSLANLSSALQLHDPSRFSENSLNMIVRELLAAELSGLYNWSFLDQSEGGWTKNGRTGERDIVIKQDRNELAVIEALKFSTSGSSGGRAHFDKISAYGNCKLFFHVTYIHSHHRKIPKDYLRRLINDRPKNLRYVNEDTVDSHGSLPSGLVGFFEDVEGRSVVVVFLLVDLGQEGQRAVIGAPLRPSQGTTVAKRKRRSSASNV
jgi:hypothetical protein